MISPTALTSKSRAASLLASLWSQPRWRLLMLLAACSSSLSITALTVALREVCGSQLEALVLLVRVAATTNRTLLGYAARGFRPKFPQWTLQFELVCAICRLVTERHGQRMVQETPARAVRESSEVVGSFFGWFARRSFQRRLERVHYNGLEHLWLRPINAPTGRRLVVLFYHGGGYALLSPRMYMYFCCALAHHIEQELHRQGGEPISVDVFAANYRKAPENPFPVPAQDSVTMYEYLVVHEGISPSQIILAGDSAGGGLVISTLLRVRDLKRDDLPLPLAAITFCPAADLTGDDGSNDDHPHCVLSKELTRTLSRSYVPTWRDRSTWLDASSVQCYLSGLPPVFVQTAKLDFIYLHGKRLFDKAVADGVADSAGWELDEHDDMPHVFSIFPPSVLPHAKVGMQRAAAFAAKHALKSHSETAVGLNQCVMAAEGA